MRIKNCARVFVGALMLAATGALHAAAIGYGNFSGAPLPPGISFQNVIESSGTDPVPLYNAPHTAATGLDFDPTSFVASGFGGAQDITDGQLNYTVKGTVDSGGSAVISTLAINESGDYSLIGTGTPATDVFAGVIVTVKVTEVDGSPITPVSFSSNASVGFNLIANPGILQPWTLSTTVPISTELSALNINYTHGATRLEVVVDNQLISQSETNSLAFIAKKDFVVSLGADVVGTPAPEPASFSLAALTLFGVLGRRRRA